MKPIVLTARATDGPFSRAVFGKEYSGPAQLAPYLEDSESLGPEWEMQTGWRFNNVPLDSGYDFSFKVTRVDEARDETIVVIGEILICRDGAPHPDLTSGAVIETLTCNGGWSSLTTV